jgi:hypothetical protein
VTTPPYEALADDTTLLTFDGRVLELFGVGDAHRLHIWQEPRLEFGTGRKHRTEIIIGQPGVQGGLDVAVDGFAYTVTVRQEFPESTDPERSVRLVVELAHGLTGRPGRWRDRKSRALEEALGVILGEIEARAVEDARGKQEEERATADREVRWRAAMEVAKEQAVRERLAQVLREEGGRWQEAAVLSVYCAALEGRIGELGGAMDASDLDSARRWLEWASGYVRSIDPLSELPKMPHVREPTLEELKPYLRGWSPYGPERQG